MCDAEARRFQAHELTVDCVAVPGDPQDVKVTPINSTAIHVEWKPPKSKEQNGVIRGYHIHVQEVREEVRSTFDSRDSPRAKMGRWINVSYVFQGKDLLNEPIRRDVHEGVLEVNITGLQPDTRYSVQVAALTRKGDGDRSPPVHVRTPGGVPNRPHVNVKYVRSLPLLFSLFLRRIFRVDSVRSRFQSFVPRSRGARARVVATHANVRRPVGVQDKVRD